jgi:hypothetical protein
MTDTEIFGLEYQNHAGIFKYDLVDGEPLEIAGHRIMRDRHRFLTDDDHMWTFKPGDQVEYLPAFSRIVVRKNEKSPYFLMKPWWVDDGPGALWFSSEFRIATREILDFEINVLIKNRDKWSAEAETYRDTIRGRKSRKNRKIAAADCDRQIHVIEKRWPQYLEFSESKSIMTWAA